MPLISISDSPGRSKARYSSRKWKPFTDRNSLVLIRFDSPPLKESINQFGNGSDGFVPPLLIRIKFSQNRSNVRFAFGQIHDPNIVGSSRNLAGLMRYDRMRWKAGRKHRVKSLFQQDLDHLLFAFGLKKIAADR